MTDWAEKIRFLASGDAALVVEFGSDIDRTLSARVVSLHRRIAEAGIDGVIETVPTFRSLLVHYDPRRIERTNLEQRIRGDLSHLEDAELAGRLWTIPVCYGGELGPDLDAVADATGLASEDVVARHSAETYYVYMIGFLPGFPYMGDLPPELALPRRADPRTHVPQGSVAIAMRMTAIYPLVSPGGWHLLGQTPVRLFNAGHEPPALFAPGDRVRFEPISPERFAELKRQAEIGQLTLTPAA